MFNSSSKKQYMNILAKWVMFKLLEHLAKSLK